MFSIKASSTGVIVHCVLDGLRWISSCIVKYNKFLSPYQCSNMDRVYHRATRRTGSKSLGKGVGSMHFVVANKLNPSHES